MRKRSERPTSVSHYPPGLSLVIAPSDITHSRPHFDYRWESMGRGEKSFEAKIQMVRLISLTLNAKKEEAEKSPSAPEEREIPVSYNLELFPAIITELIAKIWQCRNIAQQKSDEAGNTSSQMIRQVVNTLPG